MVVVVNDLSLSNLLGFHLLESWLVVALVLLNHCLIDLFIISIIFSPISPLAPFNPGYPGVPGTEGPLSPFSPFIPGVPG